MTIGKNLMIVALTVVGCITALEAIALFKGMDGAALTSSIGVIAGVPAYLVGKKITEKKLNGRK